MLRRCYLQHVTRFTTIEKRNKSCQIIRRLTRKSINWKINYFEGDVKMNKTLIFLEIKYIQFFYKKKII